MQFLEGLSDRNGADAVRGRIDWKYLLCLELEDLGFDYSVLCEFRSRLLEGGAERRLFDKVLSILREQKLVKERTLQRTDSTHVLAAVRDLNIDDLLIRQSAASAQIQRNDEAQDRRYGKRQRYRFDQAEKVRL